MNEIDKVLIDQIERNNSPSVQYLLFDKDNILHEFHTGFADIRNRRIVEMNTTYNAFSVTKTFTALGILQLYEKRKLDIEQPVKRYFPDFPYSCNITIRELLSHSSGIPNPIPLSWIHLPGEHTSFDVNHFFNYVIEENKNTKTSPNEKYAYSNLGFVLLGQLIEKVSGKTYEQYINENIINKLELGKNELGFEITELGRHAKGYHKNLTFLNLVLGFFIDKSKFMDKVEGKWKPFKNFYVNGNSYGGLIGTPNAFMKYIQILLNHDPQIISNEFKKMLFTENYTNDGKATGMCLSWFKGQLKGKEYFTHAGGGGGYYCEIRIYPELGIGSVVFFNRTGMTDERFLDKVDKFYLEKI